MENMKLLGQLVIAFNGAALAIKNRGSLAIRIIRKKKKPLNGTGGTIWGNR